MKPTSALAILLLTSACATTSAPPEPLTDRLETSTIELRKAIAAPLDDGKTSIPISQLEVRIAEIFDARAKKNTVILDRASEHLTALGVDHEREADRIVILPRSDTPLGRFASEVARAHEFAVVYEPKQLRRGVAAACTSDAIILDHRSILRGRPDRRIVRHELVHVRQYRDRGKKGGPVAVGSVLGTQKGLADLMSIDVFEIEAYGSDSEDDLRRVAKNARRMARRSLDKDEDWRSLRSSVVRTMLTASTIGAGFRAAHVAPVATSTVNGHAVIRVTDTRFRGLVRVPLPENGSRADVELQLRHGFAHARTQGAWAAATYIVMKRIEQAPNTPQRTGLICALAQVADARPDPRDPTATWTWKEADFVQTIEREAASCRSAARPLRTPVAATR